MNGIREKVARIGYKKDQAAFNLRKTPDERELEEQRSGYTNNNTKEETTEKDAKKGADAFEKGKNR